MDPLDSTAASEDIIAIDEISLVPNQFAVASSPMSQSQVNHETRFYVESTYDDGVLVGTVTDNNLVFVPQKALSVPAGGDTDVAGVSQGFQLSYERKCIDPTITVYNPTTGTSNSVEGYLYSDGGVVDSATLSPFSSAWVASFQGEDRTSFVANTPAAFATATVTGLGHEASANINLQALIDSQLGQ